MRNVLARSILTLAFALTACRDDGSHPAGEDGAADDGSGGSSGSEGGAETGSSGAADDDDGDEGSTGASETPVDEARRELPTYLDLHDKVVSRTCTPNEGVCHNDKEYPDLHTPQAMLGAIAAPCNLVVKDPLETFDGCEQRGDVVTFDYGANAGFTSEVAWIDDADPSVLVVALRDAVPLPPDEYGDGITIARSYADGDVPIAMVYGPVLYEAGGAYVAIYAFDQLGPEYGEILRGLHVGDPNRNGIYGADAPGFTMMTPGDPASSYLLGRLQGTVPGTPMPLANQPLSSAEMIALTCWIEGLAAEGAADVYASIDYDGCEAAATFGDPDPDSGHSLSVDVQPIFDQYCAAAGCHGGDLPALGLDLTRDRAYDSLQGLAMEDPSTPLVEPGNPTNSYLMVKLWTNGIAGLRMPRTATGEGEPLAEEQIAVIERWIVAGAPND